MLRRVPLLIVGLWAGLLVAFMVLRPSPNSRTFWLLVVAVLVLGSAYMLLSHREDRRTRLEATAWERKMRQLVDVYDFADDGHLPEYLDDAERQKIVEELERMPRGSRSLRRALVIVSPDLPSDDSQMS